MAATARRLRGVRPVLARLVLGRLVLGAARGCLFVGTAVVAAGNESGDTAPVVTTNVVRRDAPIDAIGVGAEQPVSVGDQDERTAIITADLSGGEVVVLSGQSRLQPGTRVTRTAAAAS